MFEYELQQIRSAELIREAQNHRLAKEAASVRRAARRAAFRSAHDGTDERAHRNRLRRNWFARAV